MARQPDLSALGPRDGERHRRGHLKGLPDEDVGADLYEATQELCEAAERAVAGSDPTLLRTTATLDGDSLEGEVVASSPFGESSSSAGATPRARWCGTAAWCSTGWRASCDRRPAPRPGGDGPRRAGRR